MSEIKGTVATAGNVKGSLNVVYGKDGASAYELAVKNGFEGSEADWIESLKGEKGDTGNPGVYLGSGDMPEEYNVQIDTEGDALTIEQLVRKVVSQVNKISTVTLPANQWEGTESPYYQVVNIAGTTANSKIDLNPTIEQLNNFHDKDITFVVANQNGVTTVYCIGQKPTNDYTIQVSIIEVTRYE